MFDKNGREIKVNVKNLKSMSFVIVSIIAVIVLISVVAAGLKTVPAGNRGVVLEWGAVTNTTLGEGLHMVTPFASTVVNMNVQTQAYDATAEAASRDLQTVATRVTVNYRLKPDKVNKIYQDLGQDYVSRVIANKVQNVVKTVTARYTAEELITKRPNVTDDIKNLMTEALLPYWIDVDGISLTNFQFDTDFTQAIEDKVSAIVRAQQAENKLREVEAIAKQTEAQARGEANAAIARAEGQAAAMAIIADAESAANAKIAASLSPMINQYRLIDKLAGDAKVIIVPSGNNLLLGSDILNATK
jgi:regulator of protease activity HflC (stomatin/prohibitin superfamily)